MNDKCSDTLDLFHDNGEAEPRISSQQVNSLLPVEIEQPAEQNARARTNSADFATLQDQAKAYARTHLTGYLIKKGYTHTGFHTYTDEHGQPIYWKVRLRHDSKGKTLHAFSINDGRPVGKDQKPAIGQFMPVEPSGKWNEVYPAGNGKKPLYRLHELVAANSVDPIYIFEGEQKADLAASLGLVATTCGGSNSISATHLKPLAGRSVVIWPDNDEAGIKARDEIAAALQAIGCSVLSIDIDALGLPEKGDIVDWVQQRTNNSQTTTKADIEALSLIKCQVISGSADSRKILSNTSGNIPKGHLCEPMAYGGNDGRFEVLPNGIFYIAKDQHDNERSHFISSPILVIAKTRDGMGNAWGRLLQWHDDERRLHQWAMPMNLLKGDGSDIRGELFDQGVMISPEKKSRDLLSVYLGSYPIDTFALCVDRLGWHGLRYVMPQQTYGQQDGQLTVFQQTSVMAASFYAQGSLADWQQQISQPCANHNRLVFALACAFAGQLLEPLNEQSGGFHIRGNSSSGKSTALKIAGSVWGNSEQVIRQWRATSNALEGIAAMHNDGFLGLDEISQCDPKDVGNTIYMLSNGQGKARMQRTGATKPVTQWRVLFLSNGEKSLDSIMGQIGKRTNAGQEIRLADIPADAGHGLGIFDPLPDGQRPADYAEQLQQVTANYYGSAGIAWLEYLTNDKQAATEQAKLLIQQFMQHYATGKSGQVQRVAKRFALVAAAGELATQAGITGWPQGRAIEAVGQCFNDWLDGFGDGANLESRNILAEVKAFFEAHGSSRFENMQPPLLNNGDEMPQRITNRVGYFKQEGNSRTYLVYPEQFKNEICAGRDARQVAKVLKEAGWLECDTGKNTKTARLPDSQTATRVYAFNGKMWQWESEVSIDTPENEGNKGNTGNSLANKGFEPVAPCETEKATHATKQATLEKGNTTKNPVSPNVAPVAHSDLERATAANPSKISHVAHVAHVTPEKQSNQTESNRRAVL